MECSAANGDRVDDAFLHIVRATISTSRMESKNPSEKANMADDKTITSFKRSLSNRGEKLMKAMRTKEEKLQTTIVKNSHMKLKNCY